MNHGQILSCSLAFILYQRALHLRRVTTEHLARGRVYGGLD